MFQRGPAAAAAARCEVIQPRWAAGKQQLQQKHAPNVKARRVTVMNASGASAI